jgi:hypothetical protein
VGRLTGYSELEQLGAELQRTRAGEAPAAFERFAQRRKQVESIATGLLETVRSQLTPPLTAPEHALDLGTGELALVGLPEQHRWLEGFLAGAATFEGLIDLQARLYQVPQGKLPEEFTGGQSGRALARDEAQRLIAWLDAHDPKPTHAPRTVTFPFLESRLAVVDEIPYVGDYEIKVLPGQDAEIVDPVVRVAEDGLHLDLRCIPTGATGLDLQLRLDNSRVRQPIESTELVLRSGFPPVTVQLPEITHVGLEGRFTLTTDETLLLITPFDPVEQLETLLLIQAHRVPRRPTNEER